MSRRYVLGSPEPPEFDREAVLRSLRRLDLSTPAGRWSACKSVEAVVSSTWCEAGQSHLWAYGLRLALAGAPEPVWAGSGGPIAQGYRAGAGLVSGALVVESPLGSRVPERRSWLS